MSASNNDQVSRVLCQALKASGGDKDIILDTHGAIAFDINAGFNGQHNVFM
jgi:hypothetical protein